MKRSLWIIALAVAITTTAAEMVVVGSGRSFANAKRTQRGANSTREPADQDQLIEQQRLDLDRQKHSDDLALQRDDLALKKEQLQVQRSQIVWTALATVIPLLAVLLTLGYNAWSFRKQTLQLSDQRRDDAEETKIRRAEDADLQFQLKAAEIAFSGESPLEVQDRAKALKQIFPTRLSHNFLVDYDPAEFGERVGKLDSKKFFLELLLKYPKPEQQFETLSLWKELFPGDVEWLLRVNLSPHQQPTKQADLSESSRESVVSAQTSTKAPSPNTEQNLPNS
jgi:hypothetical protein